VKCNQCGLDGLAIAILLQALRDAQHVDAHRPRLTAEAQQWLYHVGVWWCVAFGIQREAVEARLAMIAPVPRRRAEGRAGRGGRCIGNVIGISIILIIVL